MIVVATPDAELAIRLGGLIDGRKTYLLGPPDDLVLTEKSEEIEARAFRHSIHSSQPEVVLLDVRVGKNVFKALDHVPRLLEVTSAPAVILLLPFESRAVKKSAAHMGCYDVIILDRRRAYEKKVAKAVVDAQAARLSGALSRPRGRASGSIH